jgi:ABC-2 type transport system permease protein
MAELGTGAISQVRPAARGLRKVAAVARYEFVGTVTRIGYLITLVGMPLLFGAMSLFSGLVTSRMVVEQIAQARVIGLVDQSGLFARAPLVVEPELAIEKVPESIKARTPTLRAQIELRRFPSLDEARSALNEGALDSVLLIPGDYLATGRIDEYRRSKRGFDLTGGSGDLSRTLRSWLVGSLLSGRVDSKLAARVAKPATPTVYLVEPDGSVAEEDLVREMRPFLVPVGFSLLLVLSIFTSASYLATGLAEEKQNRALEMMLTSITPEQLFWGKLVGLWLAALLQFLLYLFAVALPAALAFAALGLHVWQAVIGFSYFVLGFFFFGAVLMTVGAIGNTQKYTQQLSGLVTFAAIVPLTIMPALLSKPTGALARLLTYVPFTAPITGMLRAGAGALPWWEFLLSLASLALGAAVVVSGCAKVFRVALFATGTTPGLAQIWAWWRA